MQSEKYVFFFLIASFSVSGCPRGRPGGWHEIRSTIARENSRLDKFDNRSVSFEEY